MQIVYQKITHLRGGGRVTLYANIIPENNTMGGNSIMQILYQKIIQCEVTLYANIYQKITQWGVILYANIIPENNTFGRNPVCK